MYKFYESIFAKCCCCCLKCPHSACVSKKVKELFPYFDPNPSLNKQTIYAQCHNIVTMEDLYGEDASINESEIKELEHLDIDCDDMEKQRISNHHHQIHHYQTDRNHNIQVINY